MVSWMKVPWLTARKQIKELEQEVEKLRRENEELRRDRERLEKDKDRLRQERDQLKEELELARRAAKRQAAPFSKGEPETNPKRPGRKGGANYGPKAHRGIPLKVDDEIPVYLPETSPCCGAEINNRRVEDQYQTEIVRKTRVTRFRVHVGNSVDCGTRVQGRNSLQTSDALGAAASQLGPGALSLAARILFHFSWTCNDRHVHMFLTSSPSARRRTNHPKDPATQLRLPARRGAETALPAARRPRRSW